MRCSADPRSKVSPVREPGHVATSKRIRLVPAGPMPWMSEEACARVLREDFWARRPANGIEGLLPGAIVPPEPAPPIAQRDRHSRGKRTISACGATQIALPVGRVWFRIGTFCVADTAWSRGCRWG
jgi:hypothetical protein